MYGKLIDGAIQFAPRKIIEGNSTTYNPTAEMLVKLGYLPIIENEPPEVEEGYYAVCFYEEINGEIIQKWKAETLPDELTAEEIANALFEVLS